jgi:hypothetical protein
MPSSRGWLVWQQRMRDLLVETNTDWHAAISLYARIGFVKCRRDEESVCLRLAPKPSTWLGTDAHACPRSVVRWPGARH